MEINNRLFKGVLAFVALLMVVGYGVGFYLKLDEPLFFQHYYDVGVYVDSNNDQNIYFDLGYITNANDDRSVKEIQFLEYPQLNIQVSENDNTYPFDGGHGQNGGLGEIHGRYSVRGVTCKILDLINSSDLNGIVLKEARVRFNDFSEMTVDVGEIHFLERNFSEIPLQHISTSSSSDGTGTTSYRVLQAMTIRSFDSPIMDKFKDRVQIKINGSNPEAALEMKIEERKFIDVTSKIGPPKDIIDKYTLFDIQPIMSMTCQEGVQYYQQFYNINSIDHSYNFFDLFRYISAREEN